MIDLPRAGVTCDLCGEEILAVFWEGRAGRSAILLEIHHVEDVKRIPRRLCHLILNRDAAIALAEKVKT